MVLVLIKFRHDVNSCRVLMHGNHVYYVTCLVQCMGGILNRRHVLCLVVMGVLILGGTGMIHADPAIPGWIKQVAGFWSNDQISDDEFLNAIEYMLQNQIITVSSSGINQVNVPKEPRANAMLGESIRVNVVPEGAVIYSMLLANNLDEPDHDKMIDTVQLWLDEGREPWEEDIEPLDRLRDYLGNIQFDWLIRQSSQYMGQELFVEGVILEVADLPQSGKYQVLLDVHETNFENDDGFALVQYNGSRMRDGDKILVAGSVSSLKVVEISNAETVVKIISGGTGADTEKIQLELPLILASSMYVMADPRNISLHDLEESTLKISRDTLKENREILEGSIVYYSGTVTSVMEDEGFRINVHSSPDDIEIIAVEYADFTKSYMRSFDIDISRYDAVSVYGLATQHLAGSDPLILALYIGE